MSSKPMVEQVGSHATRQVLEDNHSKLGSLSTRQNANGRQPDETLGASGDPVSQIESTIHPLGPNKHTVMIASSTSLNRPAEIQPQSNNLPHIVPVARRSEERVSAHATDSPSRKIKPWARVRLKPTTDTKIFEKRTNRGSVHKKRGLKQRNTRHFKRVPVSGADSDTESIHNGMCNLTSLPKLKQIGAKHKFFRPSANFIPFRQSHGLRRTRSHHVFRLRRGKMDNSSRMSVPELVRSRQTPRTISAPDLITKAVSAQLAEELPRVNEASSTVDLDDFEDAASRHDRPKSPVPTLHDPIKDRCFSEECQELIVRLGKKWDASASNDGFQNTKDGLVDKRVRRGEVHNDHDSQDSQQTAVAIVTHPSLLIPPVPPERTSSKGGPKLATLIHMSKPACIPILNGLKLGDFAGTPSARSSEILHWARPADVSSRTQKDKNLHKPILKHHRSTDTIAIIEAQIQPASEAPAILRVRRNSGAKASSVRSSTPSGEPPEKPLPDLPKSDEDATSSNGRICDPQKGTQSSTIRTVTEANTGSRRTAAGEQTTQLTPHTLLVDARNLGERPELSPTSVYSQDIAFTAPDLHKAVLKIKPVNNSRNIQISTMNTNKAENITIGFVKPRSPKDIQIARDDLDRFPAVPHSRSTSGEGISPKHSPKKKHVRNRSKLESMLHGIRSPEKDGAHDIHNSRSLVRASEALTRSGIMVIVDTDPSQAYGFRAGTISPASSHPPSWSSSPVKEKGPGREKSREVQEPCKPLEQHPSSPSILHTRQKSKETKNDYFPRIYDATLKRNQSQSSRHAPKTSRGRIIIESSEDEGDNIMPLAQDPVFPLGVNKRQSRRRSSRDSSANTSMFSFSEQKQQWKEFYQNVRQDYDEWQQMRNTMNNMRSDLDNFCKEFRQTNMVLGRMAHVGRGFEYLGSDDAEECESLLSGPSSRSRKYSCSVTSSTPRSTRQKHRAHEKSLSKSSLADNLSIKPIAEEKYSTRAAVSKERRPESYDSVNTATESDGSAHLSGSSTNTKMKKKASSDSLTDPRDYDCEPQQPHTSSSKKTKEVVPGAMDQTVIKAASISAIRRAARQGIDHSALPHSPLRFDNRSTASTPTGTKLSTEYEAKMLRRPLSPGPDSSPAAFPRWRPESSAYATSEMSSEDVAIGQVWSEDMDRAIDTLKAYL